MSEQHADEQELAAIVARLNGLEARYKRAELHHAEQQTATTRQALQEVSTAYENEMQACWDRGQIPVWNKTEGTYVIEEH